MNTEQITVVDNNQIVDNTVVLQGGVSEAERSSPKKKPVLKAIPKKIMGYLKFAHFVLSSNDDSIVSRLFLDKSIEEIVAIVNDVVENGNQDKTINELRKQLINSAKPKKTRAKKVKKTDHADAIVTDLVTLARTTADTDTPLVVPKKTRAKKVKNTDHVDAIVTDLVTTTADTDTPPLVVRKNTRAKLDTESGTVVEKKVRVKKTKTPTVETTVETTAETTADTTAHTTANTTAHTIVETTGETTADTTPNTTVETTVETTAHTTVETTAHTTAHTTADTVKKSRTKKLDQKISTTTQTKK